MTKGNSDQDLWSAMDGHITDHLLAADPVLNAVLKGSDHAGLPAINVAANQGKLLHLLARMQRARRILEIGTLGGYSSIWLARALPPGGQLITLEADPKHAAVAQSNFSLAGLATLIDLRLGPALDSLPQIAAEQTEPFDLIFIDADKPNNPAYFNWALKLSRPGTLIIGDNVIRNGAILEEHHPDERVQGTRRFFDVLASEPRVSATAIQTVGSKGYDGFVLALVR